MAALPKTKADLKSGLPDTSTTLRLKGLDESIQIYRDGYGIPHVKARTVHDAFFGQGFAAAQDRLWHMDHDRRGAYGRWAEYLGESALEQDKTMRRFQIAPTVKRDYEAINSDTRAMLDSYAAGVNAFIQTGGALPIEYALVEGEPEAWQPWDCLAVFKMRHIFMGVFERKLWRARLVNALGPERAADLLRGYQPGHLLIIPPGVEYQGPILNGLEELTRGLQNISWLGDGQAGSNSWALAGSRTASGKPLLAGDPHRGLDTPNVYYQNQVACPEFDVIGLSFPGCPGFPHFGHNAHVAWCVTHAGADYQDLFVERLREDGSVLYEDRGQWRSAEVRHEVIAVRGGTSVEIDVTVTRHGPVIVGGPEDGYGIAFQYTATSGPNLGSESIFEMMNATSAGELDAFMRSWVDPCNNFLFADVHGDIGYLNRGEVPVRPMANAWLPVPGWNGEYEWQGSIPFEELARSRNPSTGYIVTANNRIVGQDYPHYIALEYAPEHRARRITERLKPMVAATVEDMAAVHAERVSIPARTYAALLASVDPLDKRSALARDRLSGWDGAMEPDSTAPTIYSAFRARLHRLVAGHLLGPLADDVFDPASCQEGELRQLWDLLVTMARDDDTSLLAQGGDWSSLLAQALASGVADLTQQLGDDMDSWRWGTVHRTRPRHTLSAVIPELSSLLDPPSVPMGGDGDTPQAGSYCSLEPFVMTSMSVARYVFDTSDWSNSRWIVPLGASGHPGSPHYADQSAIWGEVDLIPMLYDWDRISAAAETDQMLEPQ